MEASAVETSAVETSAVKARAVEARAFGLTKGDRIVLKHMGNDPDPMKPGETGTVIGFCTAPGFEQIQMKWDSGRGLNLIPSQDGWQKI